jgi:hypothetical protein
MKKKVKCEKCEKINDGKYKLIFLLCIIFVVEFHIHHLFRVSTLNVVITTIKRIQWHMRRVLRKIYRKKKKTHWLRGV